jgi:hypothetical protein
MTLNHTEVQQYEHIQQTHPGRRKRARNSVGQPHSYGLDSGFERILNAAEIQL